MKIIKYLITALGFYVLLTLGACTGYSEQESLSLGRASLVLDDMMNAESRDNKRMKNDVEDVVFRGGNHPRDLAVLTHMNKSIDSIQDFYVNQAVSDSSIKNRFRFLKDRIKSYKNNPQFTGFYETIVKIEDTIIQRLLIGQWNLHITDQENKIINNYAEMVGSECFCFDKILPLAVPEKDTLAADSVMTYRIFMSYISCKPESASIIYGGKESRISFLRGKEIKFKVQSDTFDKNGFAKKYWDASVIFRTRTKDSVVYIHQPYYVYRKCH